MTRDRAYDEEEAARLLGVLRPAPEGWVTAAQELPRARRELDQILALAELDAEFRRALLADLEDALRQAGFEPEPGLTRVLREWLTGDASQGDRRRG